MHAKNWCCLETALYSVSFVRKAVSVACFTEALAIKVLILQSRYSTKSLSRVELISILISLDYKHCEQQGTWPKHWQSRETCIVHQSYAFSYRTNLATSGRQLCQQGIEARRVISKAAVPLIESLLYISVFLWWASMSKFSFIESAGGSFLFPI